MGQKLFDANQNFFQLYFYKVDKKKDDKKQKFNEKRLLEFQEIEKIMKNI